jgi:hypothetical protein
MTSYQVARLLAHVTGLVNQELLLQVEYLCAENRILRAHAPARLRLSNEQRTARHHPVSDGGVVATNRAESALSNRKVCRS